MQGWPETADEAVRVQERLRGRVVEAPLSGTVRTVAGLDVAYAEDRVAGAVVVLDAETLEVVASATALAEAAFPYVPGLFAFREIPVLLAALRDLDVTPDLMVCDGHGRAHPARFGLACHLGLLTGVPTFGVGKTFLVGGHVEPGRERGAATDLVHDGEVVGRTVRTQDGVRSVYVSAGHLITLDEAVAWTVRLSPSYRLPETTRRADRLCRRALSSPGG